jgi:hypothetical protein
MGTEGGASRPRGLWNLLGFCNVLVGPYRRKQEGRSCACVGLCSGRSLGIRFLKWGVVSLLSTSADFALAQGTQGRAQPGLSVDSIKNTLDPITAGIAYVILGLADVWTYIVDHPPVAILISTIIASTVAVASITNQRNTTRLRETFNTLNSDNWDEDVIKARRVFKDVRTEYEKKPHEIATLCDPKDTDIDKSQTLQRL